MKFDDKLTKQISETKYLGVENTDRYRPIIRFFFRQYEKLEYWLFKEDVFNYLKEFEGLENYTMDMCEQDLTSLVEWQSLVNIQDTANVLTVEEFTNRKYRYRLSEYAVEIERMVIRLENLKVETASLEAHLFEKIKNNLEKITTLIDNVDVHETFESLNYDFTKLSNNYKDFLKMFHEEKAEILMKSEQFLIYKNKVIEYLRDFIKGFQINNYKIIQIIKEITPEQVDNIMRFLEEYQESIPKLEPNFDYEYLKEVNKGKWNNLLKWFLSNKNEISESDRLMKSISNIINKITKYATSIIEIYGRNMNRLEEYRHLCQMFCNTESLKESHQLAAVVFGVNQIRQISMIEKNTESIELSAYESNDITITLESHSRQIKKIHEVNPIVDKSFKKAEQYERILAQKDKEAKILEKYIKKSEIIMSELSILTPFERRFFLNLITKGINKEKINYNSEHNLNYQIKRITDTKIKLKSTDGELLIPNIKIIFGGE